SLVRLCFSTRIVRPGLAQRGAPRLAVDRICCYSLKTLHSGLYFTSAMIAYAGATAKVQGVSLRSERNFDDITFRYNYRRDLRNFSGFNSIHKILRNPVNPVWSDSSRPTPTPRFIL